MSYLTFEDLVESILGAFIAIAIVWSAWEFYNIVTGG